VGGEISAVDNAIFWCSFFDHPPRSTMVSVTSPDGSPTQSRYLTPDERYTIIQFLHSVSVNGAVTHRLIRDAAENVSRSPKAVRQLWQRYALCDTNDQRLALLTRPRIDTRPPEEGP
jgi:hypothetical protein